MNKSMIRYLLAKLLLIEAMLLCVPIVVALLNLKNDFVVKDSPTVFISLFATIAILLVLGGIGSFFKPKDFHIYAKEGVLDCGFVLDPMVLLWCSSFCLFRTNPKHH